MPIPRKATELRNVGILELVRSRRLQISADPVGRAHATAADALRRFTSPRRRMRSARSWRASRTTQKNRDQRSGSCPWSCSLFQSRFFVPSIVSSHHERKGSKKYLIGRPVEAHEPQRRVPLRPRRSVACLHGIGAVTLGHRTAASQCRCPSASPNLMKIASSVPHVVPRRRQRGV